ncbi:MAG: SsrA-binding protein [Candidatus Tokpelaia sp. JSC161]|jgi:SsrA-binding protein|nr:MAG: SsrA-binding protein [Candidatus Tokpelaia sp. JSC161]
MSAGKNEQRRILAENRKARYNYEITSTLEAGLVLQGSEVKSLRANHASITDSYASLENGEVWLVNTYIPVYLQASCFNHEPRRLRKLLVRRRELLRLFNSISREGMTLIPLRLYFNMHAWVKLEIGIARGKKAYDKREREKKRDWAREKARLVR